MPRQASGLSPAAPQVILGIGDDHALSELLEPCLPENYRFQHAASPEDGIQSAAARPPDLLLASGRGIEAVQGVGGLKPGLPVVVLAAPSELKATLDRFADEPVGRQRPESNKDQAAGIRQPPLRGPTVKLLDSRPTDPERGNMQETKAANNPSPS